MNCQGRIETYPAPRGVDARLVCEVCGDVARVNLPGFHEEQIRAWAREEWLQHLNPPMVVDWQI